ncbi:MAG TPA: transglutaminase family protein [Pseudomonadales bacterium]
MLAALADDPSATIMDAALAVNACIDEDLDLSAVRRELARLCERCGEGAPWQVLKSERFAGLPPQDVVAGSRMDAVLESRRGLPITLAVLIAHLAAAAGMEARGVNFPGHFLVRVDGILVDPIALEPRTETECLAVLPGNADRAAAFAEAGPRDVALRMFNNLKFFHAGRGEHHRALDMVDCQLKLLPEHGGLILEQGECWLRLGSVQGARLAFEQIVGGGVHADEATVARALARLRELSGRSDTLH